MPAIATLAPLSSADTRSLTTGAIYRRCSSALHRPETERTLPRTNEFFYHRPNGNIDVWCRDCVREYNRQQRRHRAEGQVTRRTRAGRKFGVEMEFYGDRDNLLREMRSRGLSAVFEGYTHRVMNSWKVVTDGSVYGGWELVSPPLSGADGMDQLRKACEALKAADCSVQQSCGLHVHHDVSELTARQLGRVFRTWSNAQNAIDQLVAPSRRRTQWARPLSSREVSHIEALENTEPLTVRRHFTYVDRYRALNVACYPRQGTIEVRQHQGSLNYSKISAWVEFGQAIIAKAISDAEVGHFTDAAQLLDDLNGHGLADEKVTFLKQRAEFFAERADRVAA